MISKQPVFLISGVRLRPSWDFLPFVLNKRPQEGAVSSSDLARRRWAGKKTRRNERRSGRANRKNQSQKDAHDPELLDRNRIFEIDHLPYFQVHQAQAVTRSIRLITQNDLKHFTRHTLLAKMARGISDSVGPVP